MPDFLEALKNLVEIGLRGRKESSEIFRSVALFITYAVHKPQKSRSGTVRSRHDSGSRRVSTASMPPRRPTVTTQFAASINSSSVMTLRQLGAKVLEMYTGMLCDGASTATLEKFAKQVTNKVSYVPRKY